jgi:hypothetical protein
MELDSICDDHFWLCMIHHFHHNLSSVRRPDDTIKGICFLWQSGYIINSPIFRHYRPYATLADDVAADMTDDMVADVAFLNDM